MEFHAPGGGREQRAARNWRWMLASLGIGAVLGLVAGPQRLGMEPARITDEVATTFVRATFFVFMAAWFVTARRKRPKRTATRLFRRPVDLSPAFTAGRGLTLEQT